MAKKLSLEQIQNDIREGFKNIRSDLAGHDIKFEKISDEINKKPDREEFPQLLDKIFEYTTLKIEHEHIKKVIKEKLGVEV